MIERTTRTEIINLGNEIITGKKSDKYGRLIEPTAEVIPISNNIKLALDGDVGTLSLSVNAKYQEATQEEDVANFLLEVFDVDTNTLLGKQKINSRDVPARYNEFETPLSINIDVEKFRSKTIKLRAYLKCWLETSGWVPRGGGSESVSDEDFVKITLEVPEIKEPKQNPIVSLNVVGRGLAKDEKPKDHAQQDIGKEYRVVVTITNSAGNKLNYGELDLFENNNLLSYLSQGIKEISAGQFYPITYKFTKSWNWYKVEPDGKLTITDSKVKEFIYKFSYYLRDEFGYDYKDVVDKPLSKVKIVVSIPQYKLDAVEVYNWSFDEERNGNIASLVLALVLGAIATLVAWPALVIDSVIKGVGAGAGISIGGTVATWFAGKTVSELATELRTKLKKLIDDPPSFDRNYKNIVKVSPKKLLLPKPKTKLEKTMYKLANLKYSISLNVDALLVTASRTWSAEVKRDKLSLKEQKTMLQKFRIRLSRNFETFADILNTLSQQWKSLNLKIDKPSFIAFKKYVGQKGLPGEVKTILKKFRLSSGRIVKIQNEVSNLGVDDLDIVKYYSKYSRLTKNLAKSILKFKY